MISRTSEAHLRIPAGPGRRIHTYVMKPDEATIPRPAVLMVHGFASAGFESHRLFIRLMHKMAEAGCVSVTFDFFGSGYSSGSFEDTTVTGQVEDLRAVATTIAGLPDVDPDRIGVVGQSLGAVVAQAALHKSKLAKTFVLWATPVCFYNNIKRQYGTAWQESDVIGIDQGFLLNRRFLNDLEKFDVRSFVADCDKPKLFIHGDQDSIIDPQDALTIHNAAMPPKRLHLIAGGTHGYKGQPNLESELLDVTGTWLREHLF